MAGFAFAADDLADALELLRHALVGGDDIVEGIRDLAEDAVLLNSHSYGEVSAAHCAQGLQQILQFDRSRCIASIVAGPARPFFGEHAIGGFLIADCCLFHRHLPNKPLHPAHPNATEPIFGDKVRASWPATAGTQSQHHDASARFFGADPTSRRSQLVTLERPPAIKSAN